MDGIFQYLVDGKWEQIDNTDVASLAVTSRLFTGVGYQRYAKAGQNLVHLDCRPTQAIVRW